MSNSIIRCLWGNSKKIEEDVDIALEDDIPFICYTFGVSNHQLLLSKGVKSVLVNSNPLLYYRKGFRYQSFKYKLDIIKYAMSDFGEILYLDWDCNLIDGYKDVWQELRQKKEIQGCLYWWDSKVCNWRINKYRQHFLINTGFLYIRDKKLPDQFLKEWDKVRHWNDEISIMKVIDDIYGYQGKRYWLKYFEPLMCQLYINPVFKKKDPVFTHCKRRSEREKLLGSE